MVINPLLPPLALLAVGMIIVGWIWRWRQRKQAQSVVMPTIFVGFGCLLLLGTLSTFWNNQSHTGQLILIISFLRTLPVIGCGLVVVICVKLINMADSAIARSRRDK